MRITRDRKNLTFFIDQEQYLEKVLKKIEFPKHAHKAQKIPIDGYDSLRQAEENDVRVDPKEYATKIGSIMLAMVYTRPDLAFALGRPDQFMKGPTTHHLWPR